MLRIKILGCLLKFSYRTRLIASLFLVLIIFLGLNSCSFNKNKESLCQKYQVSKEDRIWLEEFFNELLFENAGAFVLYGNKPMCLLSLAKNPTSEEIAQWMAKYEPVSLENTSEPIKIETKTYEFSEHFEKWKKFQQKLPIHQYLFATYPNRFDPSKEDFLFFINIEMTLRTLLTFYEHFKAVVGQDFNPLDEVFNLENRDSIFWNKVLRNDALLGILLGFGMENGYFFDWMEFKDEKSKRGEFLSGLSQNTVVGKNVIEINHQLCEIPVFASYGRYPNDKQLIEEYKKQQRFIKNLYQNNDQIELSLAWLTR